MSRDPFCCLLCPRGHGLALVRGRCVMTLEMLVGPPGPTPRTAKPLGVQDFVGICWRLHATRVLEIGPVVDEGNDVRSVVAAVLRMPPSVPAWLTDPRTTASRG